MAKNDMLDNLTMWLLIIGGINWGLGLFGDFNLVTMLSFGKVIIGQIIYGAIGFSGVYQALKMFKVV